MLLAAAGLFGSAIQAQTALKVTLLEGSAKVQRSDTRTWDKLSMGDKINDNDIVETFFQAKLILNYGPANMIILGSNSKALLNLATPDDGGDIELNTTLFAGGLFVKAVSECRAGVYTSNGVARVDSGVLSAVVDSRTGHTGFQVLGGAAEVRNVAQQEGKTLSAGQTTVISPGKQPTAALHITHKHVSVLKHFFGYEYVEQEMQASNITPTEDLAPGRLSLSRNLAVRKPEEMGEARYKPLFDYNLIYGSMAEDQRRSGRRYQPLRAPRAPHGHTVDLGVRVSTGLANDDVYPIVALTPALRFNRFRIGLRFPVAKNSADTYAPNFNGLEGILDKINYLTFGNFADSIYVTLSPIRDYTISNGLVVRDFSNENAYSVLNTIGLTAHLKRYPFNIKGFIADASSFKLGGAYLRLEPGLFHIGAGYFYDIDQYETLPGDNVPRFVDLPPDTVNPDPDSVKANTHVYEADLGTDLVNNYMVRLHVLLEFAHKLIDSRTDGIAVNGPEVLLEYAWFSAGLGYNMETGRMIHGQFHPFYLTNRRRVRDGDTIITQNNVLSRKRVANGFHIRFGASPVRGTSLNLFYKQDLATRYPFVDREDDSTFSQNNYSLSVSLAADEELLQSVKFARLYARQFHGGFYPGTAAFFSSWGVEAGLDIMTSPLVSGIAFEGGAKFYYLDLDGDAAPASRFNGLLDSNDRVVELYLGIRRGFL
ncbi:MAG: hypothetical protein GF418_04915 [Chitinivibrionales bacterium]|nr:hypothetical protein [Chitinivibrionales bacterium]MBD3394950.1 hypothetical protein [Chitinivibrionales bacterium]